MWGHGDYGAQAGVQDGLGFCVDEGAGGENADAGEGAADESAVEGAGEVARTDGEVLIDHEADFLGEVEESDGGHGWLSG